MRTRFWLVAATLAGCVSDGWEVERTAGEVGETATPGAVVYRLRLGDTVVTDVTSDRERFTTVEALPDGSMRLTQRDHLGDLFWSVEGQELGPIAVAGPSTSPSFVATALRATGREVSLGCPAQPAAADVASTWLAAHDDTGACLWLQRVDGDVQVHDVAVTEEHDVLVTGTARGAAFVTRLDAGGKARWVRSYPGAELVTVAVDPAGNAYLGGTLTGASADLRVDLALGATRAALVAKLDPDGAVAWARAAGSRAYVLEIDAGRVGQVAFAGRFRGTLDFGAQAVTTNGANDDTFVAKLTTDGQPRFTRRVAGTAETTPVGVGVDNYGNVDVAVLAAPDEGAYPRQEAWSANLGDATHAVRAPALLLFKLSPASGLREWSRTRGGASPEDRVVPEALAVTPHNNRLIVVGDDATSGFIDRYYQ